MSALTFRTNIKPDNKEIYTSGGVSFLRGRKVHARYAEHINIGEPFPEHPGAPVTLCGIGQCYEDHWKYTDHTFDKVDCKNCKSSKDWTG